MALFNSDTYFYFWQQYAVPVIKKAQKTWEDWQYTQFYEFQPNSTQQPDAGILTRSTSEETNRFIKDNQVILVINDKKINLGDSKTTKETFTELFTDYPQLKSIASTIYPNLFLLFTYSSDFISKLLSHHNIVIGDFNYPAEQPFPIINPIENGLQVTIKLAAHKLLSSNQQEWHISDSACLKAEHIFIFTANEVITTQFDIYTNPALTERIDSHEATGTELHA